MAGENKSSFFGSIFKKFEKDTQAKSLKVIFVSSYLPRKCGIATYTRSVIYGLKNHMPEIKSQVVAITDTGHQHEYSERVVFEIKQEQKETYIKAAEFINQSDCDIVNLQHVFSLFGGENGSYIVDFLKNLKKPIITTMHMVYPVDQKPHPFEIVDTTFGTLTREICRLSDKIIVMIQPMADILTTQYRVPKKKIRVIPHGLPNVKKQDPQIFKEKMGLADSKIISTFGLLRAKKGLEYVIWAMPKILKENPNAIFLILGQPHPNRPKKYFYFLQHEVEKLGLLKNVLFISRYLTFKEIIRYLLASDIFVTPYLVPEQTSSGVVAYALGCGKAIISTPFLFAKETLKDGRGIFVPFENSDEIAKSVNYLFSHPEEKAEIENRAYQYGQTMLWSDVSLAYLRTYLSVLKKLKIKNAKPQTI